MMPKLSTNRQVSCDRGHKVIVHAPMLSYTQPRSVKMEPIAPGANLAPNSQPRAFSRTWAPVLCDGHARHCIGVI